MHQLQTCTTCNKNITTYITKKKQLKKSFSLNNKSTSTSNSLHNINININNKQKYKVNDVQHILPSLNISTNILKDAILTLFIYIKSKLTLNQYDNIQYKFLNILEITTKQKMRKHKQHIKTKSLCKNETNSNNKLHSYINNINNSKNSSTFSTIPHTQSQTVKNSRCNSLTHASTTKSNSQSLNSSSTTNSNLFNINSNKRSLYSLTKKNSSLQKENSVHVQNKKSFNYINRNVQHSINKSLLQNASFNCVASKNTRNYIVNSKHKGNNKKTINDIKDKLFNDKDECECENKYDGVDTGKFRKVTEKEDENKNNELLKEIKSSLDDNLKIMFNFSYECFLNKESESESKRTFEEGNVNTNSNRIDDDCINIHNNNNHHHHSNNK
jgi:hypothetical protein